MLIRRMRFCAERGVLTAPRQHSACVSCRLSAGCGSVLLEGMQNTVVELELDGVAGSRPEVGAEYMVSLPAVALLRLCAAVFPGLAILMLCGAWVACLLLPGGGDGSALAGAVAGLVVGALLLRLYDSRFGSRGPGSRLVIVPSGRVSASDS